MIDHCTLFNAFRQNFEYFIHIIPYPFLDLFRDFLSISEKKQYFFCLSCLKHCFNIPAPYPDWRSCAQDHPPVWSTLVCQAAILLSISEASCALWSGVLIRKHFSNFFLLPRWKVLLEPPVGVEVELRFNWILCSDLTEW